MHIRFSYGLHPPKQDLSNIRLSANWQHSNLQPTEDYRTDRQKERVPESNGAKTSTSAGPGAIHTHESGPTYRYQTHSGDQPGQRSHLSPQLPTPTQDRPVPECCIQMSRAHHRRDYFFRFDRGNLPRFFGPMALCSSVADPSGRRPVPRFIGFNRGSISSGLTMLR